MKAFKFLMIGLIAAFGLVSCGSVHVATDYDKAVDFDQYKTFAFYKPAIDEAKISDLDKRRILRAIDRELTAKGMTKSDDPDLLIGIATDEATNIDVYNNYYGGWGWYDPWYYGYPYGNQVYKSTEGILYINLIDAPQKNLIWQGQWTGNINPRGSVDEKTVQINNIVAETLGYYPPGSTPDKKK